MDGQDAHPTLIKLVLSQQWIELALGIEGIEVITATNVLIVDEDLRERSPTLGAHRHLTPSHFIAINTILGKLHAFLRQQGFGSNAKRAGAPGVNFNVG